MLLPFHDNGALTRRTLLKAAAALNVPPGNTLSFRLMRHGTDIGRHVISFDRQGDRLDVRIAVDARVTFLSIPFVRYTHRAGETWQGGTLMAMTGRTDRNGETITMDARRIDAGFDVMGSKITRYVAPPETLGITYWNRHMLEGPMLSLEDGVLARPVVTDRGPRTARLASGQSIAVETYNIKGTFEVDVAYDTGDEWASLVFTASDGSEIRYERL